MEKSIEFTCWKDDESIEIQLEPEAFVFTVQPGFDLKFEPINPSDDFKWALRISHQDKSVQLYPEGKTYGGIRVYENGVIKAELNFDYSIDTLKTFS